jgi:hypothetical protein
MNKISVIIHAIRRAKKAGLSVQELGRAMIKAADQAQQFSLSMDELSHVMKGRK